MLDHVVYRVSVKNDDGSFSMGDPGHVTFEESGFFGAVELMNLMR